ncbi:MAG TPA: sigma 54-interacting transcriptional regulator [Blastocatellia bacterium]|jgi:formate hydrogenlyase transcriptional activator|nr:sigma 54-interacting transcriptional regulator [Blastocatellia bacterium]
MSDDVRQLTRERDRLRLLLDVNNAVVSHLDLRDLLKAVSSFLRRLVPHEMSAIALHEPQGNMFRVGALDFPEHQDFLKESALISLEGTPAGLAFATARPTMRNRLDFEEFPAEIMRRLAALGVKSGCSVPLISHERVLGVLSLSSVRESAFTEDDVELLGQIGKQIAIAVENALNFGNAFEAQRELRRERDRSQLLLDVTNAVISHLDLRELFKVIASRVREVVDYFALNIALFDAQTGQLRIHAMEPAPLPGTAPFEEGGLHPLEGTPAEVAMASRRTVLVTREDLENSPSPLVQRILADGVKSGCVAPLIARGQVLGALQLASRIENAFSKEDAELLTQIAGQIALSVENAVAYREISTLKARLQQENVYLQEEIRQQHNFEEIIGDSAALKKVLEQVETVASTDSTVLILGETGTGKELIARAIHNLSTRRDRSLVKLNCAAIPTGLLESELFGHEKGAFTGAIAQRVGRFELAHKGTLFLDEVGDIPTELQPKLLRVLQEQEFERLGSPRTLKVDVRLIAATNSDLERLVAERKFRNDLYYRLNVFPITIPALRERREDIPLLARWFAQKFATRIRKPIESISTRTLSALCDYHWPGNVRELENVIERAVIVSRGPDLEVTLPEFKPKAVTASVADVSNDNLNLEVAEREHILKVLRDTNWMIGGSRGAAAKLGLNRSTLQSRMRKLGIVRPV